MKKCYLCGTKVSEEDAKQHRKFMNECIANEQDLEICEVVDEEMELTDCMGDKEEFMDGEVVLCNECTNKYFARVEEVKKEKKEEGELKVGKVVSFKIDEIISKLKKELEGPDLDYLDYEDGKQVGVGMAITELEKWKEEVKMWQDNTKVYLKLSKKEARNEAK